jgi:Tfp pilus assembly protein PilX
MNREGAMKRKTRHERGFALIAALLANLILLAVGIVAINLSTQDIRISMKALGDKKALNAAEGGIHRLTLIFDPDNLASMTSTSFTQVDTGGDAGTKYKVLPNSVKQASGLGSAPVYMPGYNASSAVAWGQKRYDAEVQGNNDTYGASVTVKVGLGFGPVPVSVNYN